MPAIEPMDVFERLLRDFDAARTTARRVVSVSPDGDADINMAIASFLYYCRSEEWGRSHYTFIRARCDGELSDRELEMEGAAGFRSFACLALGALLGLYASGQIDDVTFSLGDAQLPGFMYAHLPKIQQATAA